MEMSALNLSRKWRSQNFNQIIGQDIAVRILKNTLYLGHYFPVYLFSGQRGCGKTSTARIFAAALNCRALDFFKADPKQCSMPCLTCDSCVAMSNGTHPDFIEIDAASHTGVDNIRSIIESSLLLPLMGQKRIYLIDEAHMLSKAAFNAALKILEEPCPTALFILATTNHYKIIDTVRSRCFQLFFNAIESNLLCDHLRYVCNEEQIPCEKEGLELIARQSEGSVRDALNLLEQVRFSSSAVTQKAVLALLGHMSDDQIVQIIDVTLRKDVTQLLLLLSDLELHRYAAEYIWQRLMTMTRALLWMKYGVSPHSYMHPLSSLEEIEKKYSLSVIHEMIGTFYEYEELFLKTATQHNVLEMALLTSCGDKKRVEEKDQNFVQSGAGTVELTSLKKKSEVTGAVAPKDKRDFSVIIDEKNAQWVDFVKNIDSVIKDPIVQSLFKQAFFIAYDSVAKQVSIECFKDLVFFADMIEGVKHLWQPLLENVFDKDAQLCIQFSVERSGSNKIEKQKQHVNALSDISMQSVKVSNQQRSVQQNARSSHSRERLIDVSDEKKWKTASMLVRHFPGTCTEI